MFSSIKGKQCLKAHSVHKAFYWNKVSLKLDDVLYFMAKPSMFAKLFILD